MNQAPQTAQQDKAGKREWIGLGVLALPCMLYSMDLTVLNLAVPHLSAALQPSSAQLLWIVDIYGFLVAGALITMGNLGDRIGRRKLLLIGAAAFGVASVLAAFANSAETLIAARALLGIAAATLAPSTLSLIRNMFHDPAQRRLAIGVWIASFSAGGAIGPLVGGILLSYFWWGSVFLVAVPVMVMLLILGPKILPEFKDPQAQPLDILSALLSLSAILAVIYGLKRIAEQGLSWMPAAVILLGLALGAVFLSRQRRLQDPLIDLALFRIPAFSAALVINVLGFFVAFASFFYFAQYLQLYLGLTPFVAGLWTVPSGLAFVLGAMLTARFAAHFRPACVMAGGLLLAALGFAATAWLAPSGALLVLVAASFIYCLGLAPVFTLSTDLIVGVAPPARAGSASAVSETSSEFGGALGIAVLGSLATFLYRSAMTQADVQQLSAEVLRSASDTLGGALEAAATLDPMAQAQLVDVSRQAFLSGFGALFLLGALVLVIAACICILWLRSLGADANSQQTEDEQSSAEQIA